MEIKRQDDGTLEIEGMGAHSFRVAPRVGEHITIGDEATSEAFEVIAVLHAADPSDATDAGDLIVRHTGTDQDFIDSLLNGGTNAVKHMPH